MRFARIMLSALVVLAALIEARAIEKGYDQVWRERIEADCKLQARRYYSLIAIKKRWLFVKHCIERSYR